jgi:GNAT superfamily N-acetyltransferase
MKSELAMEVRVIEAMPEHAPLMLALEDAEYGPGWSLVAIIEERLRGGCGLVAVCRAVEAEGVGAEFRSDNGDAVVGMRLFAAPGAWDTTSADMGPCSPDRWREMGFQRLALARAVVVHPAMQKRGIGQRLMAESFRRARHVHGADGMVVHVWASSPSATALAHKRRDDVPLLEVARHPEAWRRYSVESGWKCLYCGPPPCLCEAIECIYDLRNL